MPMRTRKASSASSAMTSSQELSAPVEHPPPEPPPPSPPPPPPGTVPLTVNDVARAKTWFSEMIGRGYFCFRPIAG
jgi:hypothetical protein